MPSTRCPMSPVGSSASARSRARSWKLQRQAALHGLVSVARASMQHRDRLRPRQRLTGGGCGQEEVPRHPAQGRGRARCPAVRPHPRHLRRRLLRRPDHPLRGREGVRPLPGRRLPRARARHAAPSSTPGIVFEEYRGRVGTVGFTDASKAYFFPVGVPGLFLAIQRACRLRRDREHGRLAALCQAGRRPAVRPLGHAARAVQPAAHLHRPRC